MRTKRADYVAYMLRLWRSRGLWGITWRASLEDAETRDVHGFRSLEALVAFLQEMIQVREAKS